MLLRPRLVDPSTYLLLAEELLEQGGPVRCRSAINRAYYAAFTVCHEALVEIGCQVPETSHGHKHVRDILQKCSNRELRLAGKSLKDLYDWRLKADYRHQDPRPERPENVREAIKIATTVITLVTSSAVLDEYRAIILASDAALR